MNFGQAIASGFKNYIGFEGRACRSEYWFWVLFVFLAGIALAIVDSALFPGTESGLLSPLFGLAVFVPGVAMGVRRLHDIDRTGWWLLISLIPIVGLIVLIVWAIQKGTDGANRFGADPLAIPATP